MLTKLFPEYFISLHDKKTLSTIVHYATLLSIAVFIPYYLFNSIKQMYLTDSIMVLILLLISIFFKRGYYFVGKLLSLTTTTIYLSILTFIFLDYKTNTNLFFFLLIIVSLTITDYNQTKERYLAIIFFFYNYSILKYQHKLNQLATTDPLTGILNRRSFLSKGNKIFSRSTLY